MKNHMKRIPAPKSWIIDRKKNTYIARPISSGHPMENGLALGVIIRDMLGFASTMNEVKKMLNNHDVLVDNVRRKDHHLLVGLFDVITFTKLKKSYQILFDNKGRIVTKEVKAPSTKTCKIIGKTTLSKGRMQYHLHDGKNFLSDKKIKVGDSVVVSVPKLEVKDVLELKPGVKVYLTKGKHQGSVGKLKEIKGDEAVYEANGQEIETAARYLFVMSD